MTPARCDDPNCSCRSPELQWFTDQVLRRDAGKTDYMVIPLLAGVMARCILADDSRRTNDPEDVSLNAEAQAIVDLAERGRTEAWDDDLHAFGIIANLVFCNWPAAMSFGSVSYERHTLGIPFTAGGDQQIAAAVKFLTAQAPPSLTETVILSMIASLRGDDNKGSLPLLGKGGRRLRVVIADRLRREGLVTWPKILAAAVDDWSVPTLERLARHNAAAGDAAIHYVIDLTEAAGRDAAAEDVAVRPPSPPSGPVTPANDQRADEAKAAEELIDDAVSEIKFWREQRDAVQRERDTFAQRDSRSRSRLESLERQLAQERARRQALERELAALRLEREQYEERLAAEEAIEPHAPAPATDVFAGRHVLFFTGAESADTRAALAQGFWDLGAAQVDTYWTDKSRGPESFPADGVIAIDVSFMAHTAWSAIVDKARSAGAWCYWGKHGATTMARATAAAWTKHTARDG